MENKLVLSIFGGIDVLGLGFEQNGFCVVQAQDKITGGEIRRFFPPSNVFAGVIGGSPCQDFSALNRNPKDYSLEMQKEYCRVVDESNPDWFLYENVARAPSFEVNGYSQQRFALNLAWFNGYSRLRHFTFGSRNGVLLNPKIETIGVTKGGAVVGNDSRSFRACCDIQGLPSEFDLPEFNATGKKKVVANAVPLPMADYVAKLVNESMYSGGTADKSVVDFRKCLCGCGRAVVGRFFVYGYDFKISIRVLNLCPTTRRERL